MCGKIYVYSNGTFRTIKKNEEEEKKIEKNEEEEKKTKKNEEGKKKKKIKKNEERGSRRGGCQYSEASQNAT